MPFKSLIRLASILLFFTIFLTNSSVPLNDKLTYIRVFTRENEFNYLTWMLQALQIKLSQSALNSEHYLTTNDQYKMVEIYLGLVDQIRVLESQYVLLLSESNPHSSKEFNKELQNKLDILYENRNLMNPVVEAILQYQLTTIIAEARLSFAGQPVPPILFHSTPIPTALIVSPRNIIQQDANISLETELTLQDQIILENKIAEAMNVSTLVVEIGGIGIYPTMVMQTTDMNWLAEVIAHEWIHNYLSLRPLGINYTTNSALRTMNETTAAIAGKELGNKLIAKFYPEFLPQPIPPQIEAMHSESENHAPPVFDFRVEMHKTRVTVDELLKEDKIEQAENYMEERRLFFRENGYMIRKLNQAYFAFHGAYADEPIGAAGKDIVGEAVRSFRAGSSTLDEFIKRISWMWSFEQLQSALMAD